MAKRKSYGADGEEPRKRARIAHEAPTSEDVHTARQLKQLLTFTQDIKQARHGIKSFKIFLDSLCETDTPNPERLAILSSWLEACQPRHAEDDDEAVFVQDVIETWSYASQINNDDLMAAVPVVLVLLLRIISPNLSLRQHGLGVCRTLLQKRQLDLIARNMCVDKGKEFIISPTLRLVREAVSFDGGTFAKAFFRARNFAYKALARNMGIKYLGEGVEERNRPSARTNAIRLFLSSLRLLHLEAKAELLSQRDLIVALSKNLKNDPPHLVHEVLDGLKTMVLLDKKMPRLARTRLLSSNTLTRIASLYTYSHGSPEGEDKVVIPDLAHEFLVLACTSQSTGVLYDQKGFYPKGMDVRSDEELDGIEGAELNRINLATDYAQEIPVHNTILLDFIQTLRPWSSTRHTQLLLAILTAAPELIASYFFTKREFTFEPKLSATWIGYAALLFNVVQLPTPPFFGNKLGYAHVPPPTSILLDSILPLPLTQKVLSRSLSMKSKLIPFFIVRILALAMEKLQHVLKLHQDAMPKNRSLWAESARSLVDEFSRRCPSMKEIIQTFRAVPKEDTLFREAASRLLRLSYEVIPQIALASNFDVAPLLIEALDATMTDNDKSEDGALRILELENLVGVASTSPGMRWFANSAGLSLSPFVTLLKVYVEASPGSAADRFESVLEFVLEEQQIVIGTRPRLRLLIDALRWTRDSEADKVSSSVWTFLDSCASRCATGQLKYMAQIADVSTQLGVSDAGQVSASVSPLAATVAEQLPFVLASNSKADIKLVCQFVAAFYGFCILAGQNEVVLRGLLSQVVSASTLKSDIQKAFKIPKGLKWSAKQGRKPNSGANVTVAAVSSDATSVQDISLTEADELLAVPIAEDEDHDNAGLLKWISKSADEIVEEGYAESLIRLLSSEHTSIRKEALIGILKMKEKIKESSYEEKDQVWLLLAELAESARPHVDRAPLANYMVAFSCAALRVLSNPLHPLYEKVNTFLTGGPTWELGKLPLVHAVLQERPTNDNAYYTEHSWLFTYLIDSLRTPADLSLFHNKRIFARVMSLAKNPYLRQGLRTQILRLLYRATSIEGGATTLVTRFGVMSWLEVQMAELAGNGEGEAKLCKALMRRIWEKCDQERVSDWSKGSVAGRVEVV